jgi:hypothetical protein
MPPNSDRIAICGEVTPDFLKQRLLFFDRIGVFELDRAIIHWRSGPEPIPGLVDLANDLEFLQSRDLVFDAEPFLPKKFTLNGKLLPIFDEDEAFEELFATLILRVEFLFKLEVSRSLKKKLTRDGGSLREIRRYVLLNARRQFEARSCARCMRRIDRLNASAVLSEPMRWDLLTEFFSEVPRPLTHVIDVVLDKLPMPSELTPWERILDFKADTEAQGYLQGLKVWMGEIARQKLTANEAREKLEWLLFQHKRHMKAHKLSFRWGTLGGAFIAGAEILEDLAKIKLGKAAGAVVSIVDRRIVSGLSAPR